MKKAFIFKPSTEWSYCGGGRVCIAESFEEAVSLFDAGDHFFIDEETCEKWVKNVGDTYDLWVLVSEVIVMGDEENRVLLDDYNWG